MQSQIILQGYSKEELLQDFAALMRSEFQAIPKPEKINLYMDVDECSEFIHESKQTIYTRTHKKTMPFLKRNGKLLFNRSEIIKWLEEGAQPVEP